MPAYLRVKFVIQEKSATLTTQPGIENWLLKKSPDLEMLSEIALPPAANHNLLLVRLCLATWLYLSNPMLVGTRKLCWISEDVRSLRHYCIKM